MYDPTSRETAYTIGSGDCRISWTVFRTEANRGIVRHRADCGRPLAGQAPLIERVLRHVLAGDPDAKQFRALMWGRLYPDGARDDTLALRLASAAQASAEWDVRKGAPLEGSENGWVRSLANREMIYEELRQVFAAAGLEIRLSSVEKVLVEEAARLPFFEALRARGARPKDRLPYDCQAWFSVRGMDGGGAE